MQWKDLARMIEAVTPDEVKRAKREMTDQIDAAINEGLTLMAKTDNARRVVKYRNRLLNADAEWRKQEGF